MSQAALAISTATAPTQAPSGSQGWRHNLTVGCVTAIVASAMPLIGDAVGWASGSAIPAWRWGLDGLAVAGAVAGVAWTMRTMKQRVRAIRRDMLTLSMGDLRQPIVSDADDALGSLQRELAMLQAALTDIIRAVRHASNEVVHSAIEVTHGARDVAARAESSAAALEESSAALEQTSSTSAHTADLVAQAADLAQTNAASASTESRCINRAT